jgi:frataxin-like iron-binding protein CyaY
MTDKPKKTPARSNGKHPGGRPTDYNQETAGTICAMLANGHSLREIVKGEGMPNMTTVFRWLSFHPEFSKQYALAREEQAELLADEIVNISDEESVTVEVNGEKMEVKFDSAMVARNRLRIDARKWVASKLKPKKYGDKLELEQSGKNGGPIQHEHKVEVKLTAEEAYLKAIGKA